MQHGASRARKGETMKKALLSAAALATVLAGQALGQEGTYIKGAVGYGLMDEADIVRPGGTGEINPEGDARFMLGVGHAFPNNWRIDVDVVDRYADGGGVNNGAGSTDIQNVTLMLNGIYDINREGRFNPYVGLGLGAARTDVGISTTFGGPALNAEASSTEFAYQGLAGLGVRLSDRLTADFEYRYVDIGDVDGTGFAFEDMESHDFLIGLRYAFAAAPRAAAPAPAPAPPTAAAAPVGPTCDNVDFIVYFEFDRSDLTDQAVTTISTAASQASACQITRVSVVGHTDRSGADAYNVQLSDRRARAVREELIRRGVPASTIAVEARGENAPAVATPDGVREPLNRRSEVVIVVGSPST
jgi:outer membrane protein OmpA-like peptidoglycan-associated protein/outer membrane protein W